MKCLSSPELAEIDLCGQECRAFEAACLAAPGSDGQGGGERGARDAIADGMDRRHFQPLADRIDRFDLRSDIIVPHHLSHAFVGRFPGDHEHRDALLHRPAHKAFRRVEIENIEAVDPRREDHQRRGQHFVGHRCILDQLIERRLMDHLAGGDGDVFAQREGGRIGVAELAARQIGNQMLQPLDQAGTLGLDRLVQRHRIGQGKIGGRKRVGGHIEGKAQLLALFRRNGIGAVCQHGQLLSQHQISLVKQLEERLFAPGGVGKALVSAVLCGLQPFGKLRPDRRAFRSDLLPLAQLRRLLLQMAQPQLLQTGGCIQPFIRACILTTFARRCRKLAKQLLRDPGLSLQQPGKGISHAAIAASVLGHPDPNGSLLHALNRGRLKVPPRRSALAAIAADVIQACSSGVIAASQKCDFFSASISLCKPFSRKGGTLRYFAHATRGLPGYCQR